MTNWSLRLQGWCGLVPFDRATSATLFLHKTVLYKKLGWHLFNVGHLYQHLSRRYWGQMLQTHTLPSCSKIYCLLPQNINYGVPAATKLNLCCLNDLFWALTLAAAPGPAQPGVSQPRRTGQVIFEDQNYPDPSLHHNIGDISDRPGLGWVGLGGELQALDQLSAPRNFSLAPNLLLTHCYFTSGYSRERKIPSQSRVFRQVRADRRGPTLSSYLIWDVSLCQSSVRILPWGAKWSQP